MSGRGWRLANVFKAITDVSRDPAILDPMCSFCNRDRSRLWRKRTGFKAQRAATTGEPGQAPDVHPRARFPQRRTSHRDGAYPASRLFTTALALAKRSEEHTSELQSREN